MAIDLGRVVQAALEAATQGPSSEGEVKKRRPHLSGGRALLLGAGLLTVGRLAAPKGREILNALQQTSEEHEWDAEAEDTEDRYDEGEPEGEGDEDFDEEEGYEEEEAEGEGDEDFDEEEGYEEEEPEGEGDEDIDQQEDEDERPRPRRRTRTRARSRS